MNIRVTITFLGPFEKFAGKREESIQVEHGSTVADAINVVKKSFGSEHVQFLEHALVARNGSIVRHDEALSDKDNIILMSPVIGGG